MPSSCSVFIATSLDGYIAREDGRIDWLEQANTLIPAGEDCGYQPFFASVDALVMGRNTFELVRSFEPWPYGEKRVVVLSHQSLEIPAVLSHTVSHSSLPPKALIAQLAKQGLNRLYIDGGKTIQGFLRDGLIDELIITTIPVLLGQGRPLFGPLEHDIKLQHLASHAYPFGFVQNRYKVIHDE